MPRKRRQLGGIDRLRSGRDRVRVTDEATGERLSLGTYVTKADAERVCSELRIGPKACFPTPYTGAPL